ncbi:MAG: NUDIX domain-containing protein [Chlamydiae bacterium]|nr:NUDIX domain-containing protein [Chlamydiota bacterium]
MEREIKQDIFQKPKIDKFHLGIYAIIEKEGKILLVEKTRGPYWGKWDLPGGRPIHGETIFETLFREVKEETGIAILDAKPALNIAFAVDYIEGSDPISLHHTCLIYKVTRFDAANYQDSIHLEDVQGASWIEKSQLETIPLSKVAASIV